MTDGKLEKPDTSYSFTGNWVLVEMDFDAGQMMLLTLDIPEKLVLLSDANT